MALQWNITPVTIDGKGSRGYRVIIGRYTVTEGTIPKTGGEFTYSNTPDWITDILISRTTETAGVIYAETKSNTSESSRTGYMTFNYTNGSESVDADASFTQTSPDDNPSYGFLSFPYNVYIPRGKTYGVIVTAGDVYKKEVYRGKPYIEAGGVSTVVEINQIAKQFVTTQMNDIDSYNLGEVETDHNNYVRCDVRYWDDATGSIDVPEYRMVIVFNNDWSYDHSRYTRYTMAKEYSPTNPRTGLIILNDPINGHASPLQRFTFNVWSESGSDDDKYIIESNGEVIYESEVNYPTKFFSPNAKITIDNVDVTNNVSIKKSNSDESIFYDTSYCGDYVLRYLNAYGGYDSFLIENHVTVSRTGEKTSYGLPKGTPVFSADDRRGRGNVNILTETFNFNTGWLTDEESEKFYYHALSSPEIYIEYLEDKIVTPVTIEDLSAERKTFRGGRKLVSYDVRLKSMSNTERR